MAIYLGDTTDNTLRGTIERDTMFGGSGDDTLFGGASNDSVYGGVGDDVLYAGSGNDILNGQSGDDLLFGGSGNDVFSMNNCTNHDADFIGDFQNGKDSLDVVDPFKYDTNENGKLDDGDGRVVFDEVSDWLVLTHAKGGLIVFMGVDEVWL